MVKQYSVEELKQIAQNFKCEFELAIEGKPSSLPFIPNPLPHLSNIKQGELLQVMVIGGTVFRSALVKKANGLELQNITETSIPQFLKKNDLHKFITSKIDPAVDHVVINLAYALKPVYREGRIDGIFQYGGKENQFHDLVGSLVGESVEKYYAEQAGKTIKLSVANDTICLLLSGLTQQKLDHLGALIVGTGFNSAVVLNSEVVNLETANFDKFPQTAEGKIIDTQSAQPGLALFEKEIAGGYLYMHFNELIRQGTIQAKPIASTAELSTIAAGKGEGDANAQQAATILLNRSASLVAAHIAALLWHYNHDITFITEGSLFWKGSTYRETVKTTLNLINPTNTASFVSIPNSDLLGAASLAVGQ